MSVPAQTGSIEGIGAASITGTSAMNIQTVFDNAKQELLGLTKSIEALRTEQTQLTNSLADQRSALSSSIAELTTQRDTIRTEVAEEEKAADWWRKKEESTIRRTGDVSGRLARSAWLSEERCRRLQEQIDKMVREREGEDEALLEKERGVAMGLRDRIGRLESRLRATRDEADSALQAQEGYKKEMSEEAEKAGREKEGLKGEIEDLRAALREQRLGREQKEREIERLQEALRASMEEGRRLKATSSVVLAPSRILTPQQMNIPRPQTPPRSSHNPLSVAKSPNPTLDSPKSLARAYAYLDKRHNEAQAQNAKLEIALRKSQTTLKELCEQHKVDREKFLEWKKLESERSSVRKRKREEKRRERGDIAVLDGERGLGKRRKSEGGALIEGSDESAPVAEAAAGASSGKEVSTSQTIEDDTAGGQVNGGVGQIQADAEEEEEEEEEYYSPSDVFVHTVHPSSTIQRQPVPMGISQQFDQSSRPSVESRPREPLVAMSTQQPATTLRQPAPVADAIETTNQGTHRGRSQAPRVELPSATQRDRSRSSHRKSAKRYESPYAGSTHRSAGPDQPSSKPTYVRERTASPEKPHQTNTTARRSVSPRKSLSAFPSIPGAGPTTPWLGGGYVVRTGSKSNLRTNADPFDLSPPPTRGQVQQAGPSSSSTAMYSTPTTSRPSLIRDRGGGDTSLRRAALTRLPSDISNPKRQPESSKRTGSRHGMNEESFGSPRIDNLGLEGLSPAEKAKRLKQLNKLSASEKREVYKGYKLEGGRYLGVDEVRKPVTEAYEIDPSKNDGKNHQYHSVVRRKEDRKCMHGGDCEECRDWYEAIGPIPRFNQAPAFGDQTKNTTNEDEEGIRRHQNMVSRHRETWVKPPTPPGFWSIGFPTTQDVEAQNKRADDMEREKEKRILREAAATNSKWRKKS